MRAPNTSHGCGLYFAARAIRVRAVLAARAIRVRAVLAARAIIDRDVKIEHARIAHSERLYGCGLYLEPAQ